LTFHFETIALFQVMQKPQYPITGSKRRLLDAAEQLFADKGFEAVSVRDITKLAKQNVASVNYHFGGRDALLGLVMMRFMQPVTEKRLEYLTILEKKSPLQLQLEDVIEALVSPLVSEVSKSDLSEQLFHRLMGRIFSEQGNGHPLAIESQIQLVYDRFNQLFKKVLPHSTAEELAWNTHFLVGGMLHLLTHQDVITRLSKGVSGSPTMDVTLKRFIKFSAAGMRGGQIQTNVGPEEIAELESLPSPMQQDPQVMFDF
jgi:AcrR family transcriptional regulator